MELKPTQTLGEQIRNAYNRMITVDMPDELDARRVGVFITLMLVSVGVLVVMSLSFLVAGALDIMSAPAYVIGAVFPAVYIPVTIFAIASVRQQRLWVIDFYIWFNLITVFAACIVYDGYLSPGWLLFFWTVSFAGVFLKPVHALSMTGAALGVYALLLALSQVQIQGVSIYQPYFTLTPEARTFFFLVFGLLMLFFSGGMITYLNMRNLGEILVQLREAQRDLEAGRESLSQQVSERTYALSRRAEDFQTVAELNRVLGELLNTEDVLTVSVKFVAERLGHYHAGIFLLDETRQWALLRAASSEGGQRMLARDHRLRVGEQGVVGHVALTGHTRVAFDVGDDAVWFSNPDLPRTRSELALPLISRERVIGVLDIQSEQPRAFSEADIQVLRILADGLAVSIENTRLLQSTRSALERLSRYQEEDVLRGWREALARRDLDLAYRYNRAEVQAQEEPDAALLAETQALHELQVSVREDGRYQLLAPVQVRGKTVGVLAFDNARPWAEEELQLAETVVLQLGLALENARLLEDTRLRARTEQARSEIVARVRASVNVDAILRSAAEELGRALQLERARVQLLPGQIKHEGDGSV